MPPARRYLAWVGRAVAWTAVVAAVWLLWPATLGGATSLVVVSGDSMEPTYSSGDLVVARSGSPQVGDVIVYNPEGYGRAQIVHRVVAGDAGGWVMQGDNNDYLDPFTPDDDAVVGVVRVHLPGVGWLTRLLLNPYTWAFAILAALVLLLWFSGSDPDEDEPHGAAAAEDDEPADAGYVAWTVAAGLALAGVLAFAFSTPASASQLAISTSANLAQVTSLSCAAGATLPTTVSGPATGTSHGAVQVAAVPAACAGITMTVRLYDAAGTQIATGASTAAAGTNAVVTGSYDATTVRSATVRFDVPALTSWSYTPPAASCQSFNTNGTPHPAPCTFTVTSTSTWTGGGYRYTNVTFTAVTTAPIWQITVDLSSTAQGFTGVSPVRFVGTYQNVAAAPGYSCTQLPVFVGREANPSWNSSGGELIMSDDPGYSAGTTLCDG